MSSIDAQGQLTNFVHPTAKHAYEEQLLKEHKSRMEKFMKEHQHIFNLKIRKTISLIYDEKIDKDNIIKLVTHPMRSFIIALTSDDPNELIALTKFTSYVQLPEGGEDDED